MVEIIRKNTVQFLTVNYFLEKISLKDVLQDPK